MRNRFVRAKAVVKGLYFWIARAERARGRGRGRGRGRAGASDHFCFLSRRCQLRKHHTNIALLRVDGFTDFPRRHSSCVVNYADWATFSFSRQ